MHCVEMIYEAAARAAARASSRSLRELFSETASLALAAWARASPHPAHPWRHALSSARAESSSGE